MKNLIKRPWQGTTLGIIFSLLVIAIPIITIVGLTSFVMSIIISQSAKVAASFLGIFPVVLGVAFMFVIGITLISVGVFYGRRWIIGIILVGTVMNLFNGVLAVVKALITFNMQYVFTGTVGLLVTSFVLWLSISSLKHPFYGGYKNKLNWKSWEGIKSIFKRNKNVDEMTTF